MTKQPATLEQRDIPLGDRENMVFMGTSVAAGTGEAVVVATAMKTELGRIAGLIEEAGAEEGTPLQKKLESFGRVLVWAALGIVALLFGLGLLRGTKPFELFMTSVSLAVAAVPEGLPAVVTVALALGVLRMSRRRALVRKLAAVETLGSTTVICTDKTGTLTVGEMTVRALYVAGQRYEVTGEGYGPDGEVRFEGKKADAPHARAVARTRDRPPRLQQRASRSGRGHVENRRRSHRRRAAGRRPPKPAVTASASSRSCRSITKFRSTPTANAARSFAGCRTGSSARSSTARPTCCLERCTHALHQHRGPPPDRGGSRAPSWRRTAAMAQASPARARLGLSRPGHMRSPADLTADAVEHDLVFVGLSGMYDPPRPEAKEAVAKCHAAGIRVVMITGDHPHTAMAIAREIGIASADDTAIAGVELDKLSDGRTPRNARPTSPSTPASPPSTNCASSAPGKRTMPWSR